MSALKQLFTPLLYLKIRHPLKPLFDWYIPLFLSVVVVAIIFVLPKKVDIFGNSGLIFIITDLVKILVGFYIAALAAVATFQSPPMDAPFNGDQAILKIKVKDKNGDSNLTRRQFLCYLFGYLAFMGVVIYFIGAIVTLLAANLKMLSVWSFFDEAKLVFIFFYVLLTANSLTTTMLGLHFLSDRMHRI